MTTTVTVNEKTSAQYTATLKDQAGIMVPLANLSTLTITLYAPNAIGAPIINSRNAQNVKNANGGTYGTTDGKFTMLFDPADNAIIDTTLAQERHVALFQATWSGGGANWELEILVNNLQKIT